jgi:hypothetical protein
MARSKAKPPAPANAIPDYIVNAPLVRKKKIAKKQLPSYTEAMMLLHAPELQRLFWQAMIKGVTEGDKEFVRMTGEIFELLKKGGGVSVVQQTFNQTAMSGTQDAISGYDTFVRQLAIARSTPALPEPQIIDVRPAEGD